MNRDLQQLYQQIILQHDRAPFHYQKMPDAPIVVSAYNPVCGDRFELFLNVADQHVREAYFHGYGCAISKASTSVLIQKIQQLPIAALPQLFESFFQIVSATPAATPASTDDPLLAFAAAQQFPERLPCATLSWEALRDFLQQRSS